MRKLLFFSSLVLSTSLITTQSIAASETPYYPPSNKWLEKSSSALDLDQQKLEEAVTFAKQNEYSGSKDLRIAILNGFKAEPFHEILGPTKKRGGPAGLILKNGYIAAKWGDLKRVDMTFSVTKSYLSTMAGLALDSGFWID